MAEIQNRIKFLVDVIDYAKYFFTDDYEYNEQVVESILDKPGIEDILEYIYDALESVPEFTEEHVKPLFKKDWKNSMLKWVD